MFTRCYALMYDRISRGSERAGLRDERAALLAQAHGYTVEIGAGTGLNLTHYPASITSLTRVEPDQYMRKRLRRRVAQRRPDAAVLDGRAETLPVEETSFDTVVGSFVLCSVDDQAAVLDEIARVLRPGGQLLFLEHVRDQDPKIAKKQDNAPFLYSWMGCHPNRATLDAITRSKLLVAAVRRGEVPKAPAIERPMVVGRATLSAD